MTKISVIVPIYNVENYLMKCLNSLLHQTMSDIEFLLMNDGSTDNSGKIARDFANQHPESFRYYSHVNMGLSKTRNRGISLAKGKYIGFVDSDDFVEDTAFEILYKAAIMKNADIVYAPYYIIDVNGNKSIVGKLKKPTRTDYLEKGVVSFCNKLFKRELLINAGDIPDMWYEDFAYVMPLMATCRRMAYVPKPLYYYVKRNNSIMGQNRSRKSLEMIMGWDIALNKSPFEYQDNIRVNILNRLPNVSQNYFLFRTSFILAGIRYLSQMEDDKKRCIDATIVEWIKGEKKALDSGIGNVVYINGLKNKTISEPEIFNKYKSLFSVETEVIILTEENCPEVLSDHRLYEEWKADNIDALGVYCALVKMKKHGGMFIGRSIVDITCLDYLQSYKCVFTFLKPNVISRDFWGISKENSSLIEALLESYWENSDSFDKILVGSQLKGKKEIFPGIYCNSNGYIFLAPEISVLNFGTVENLCIRRIENGSIVEGKIHYKVEELFETIELNYLKQELWRLRQENDKILNSTSWRITAPLRKIMDYLKNKGVV